MLTNLNTISFTNDFNVTIKAPNNGKGFQLSQRVDSEQFFRKIHSFMIVENIIRGNIIDLGAWIGDNTLPWAKLTKHQVIAIDPSPNNIMFIEEMASLNNIKNIRTIQCAVSDHSGTLSTCDNIDHCSFINNLQKRNCETNEIQAFSLDNLFDDNNNIDYIHLDVEGFESKVVHGGKNLIKRCRPIVTFEQHIKNEPYIILATFFNNLDYDVYIINEVLKGCNPDCRNFIAFPCERNIDIDSIHQYIGRRIILSISKSKSIIHKFHGIMCGNYMGGKKIDVISVQHINNIWHIFAIHDDGFTKMVAVDEDGKWVGSRYIMSLIDINDPNAISNAYDYPNTIVNQNQYNIINITQI